jgi:hypothetical protein
MHESRQHLRPITLTAACLTLLGAALLSAQRSTSQAQERLLRQHAEGPREKVTRADETLPGVSPPAPQTAAPDAPEADCTIRLERRTYCARLTLDGDQDPAIRSGLARNVTSTIVAVADINGDASVTGSNNYVVSVRVGGVASQGSNGSIQKAFDNSDVSQAGSNTTSLASGNFSVRQTASASYLTADDNVFVIQDGTRSHQIAGGGNGTVTQRGFYNMNVATTARLVTQSGHNTANYYIGSEEGDVLWMGSSPVNNTYTGNRFVARTGSGDDYVKVDGTKLTAEIDGGGDSDAVQLQQGPARDWVVTRNFDGSTTYTNERQGHVVTVRNVEHVIIGDNFPTPLAEAERHPLEVVQRVAEQIGMSLNLPWRAVQADHLMRQRLAEIESASKERLRQAAAAEGEQ